MCLRAGKGTKKTVGWVALLVFVGTEFGVGRSFRVCVCGGEKIGKFQISKVVCRENDENDGRLELASGGKLCERLGGKRNGGATARFVFVPETGVVVA